MSNDAAKSAAATTAGVIATVARSGDPSGGAAAGGVGLVWTAAGSISDRITRRRFDRFNAALLEALRLKDADELYVLHEQLEDDPRLRDLLLAAFRSIIETVAETALDAVARLTAEYLDGGKTIDSFFKRTASLFVDVTEHEYEGLRLVVHDVELRRGESAFGFITARDGELRVGFDHAAGGDFVAYDVDGREREIVRLLLKHGFAGERTPSNPGTIQGKRKEAPSADLLLGEFAKLTEYLR